MLGAQNSSRYIAKVKNLGPIGYWPMVENSGTISLDESGSRRDGVYTAVTLGQTGIGDGRTAASFNGTTSFNDIYTAGLAGAFNGNEGTLHMWIKASAVGIWTDAVARSLAYLQVNTNNRVSFDRLTSNNNVRVRHVGGATSKTVTIAAGPSTGWISLGMTWSDTADQMIAYLNGVQSGATQTALGTFVGSLVSTTTILGTENTTPVTLWSGFLAHAAVWATPLSAAQMLTLATVP